MKNLTTACLFVATAVAIVSFIAPTVFGQEKKVDPLPDKSVTDRVDKLFEKWDKPDSPGCALGIVKDGELIYKRGYGSASIEYAIPITPTTRFNAGSISKQFTATAIALLAQQRKLSLDDNVRKYIAELPDFGTPITIRHLLHHTSGLRCDLVGLPGRPDYVTEQYVLQLLSQQKELNSRPGEKYVYCNTGYELLAVIVKRVSGQSLRDFSRTNIFDPLGMKQTFFREDAREMVGNLASGYRPTSANAFRKEFPSWSVVGAAGLITTVEDLALWDQNFYNPRVGGQGFIDQLHERATLNSGESADYGYSFGSFTRKYKGVRTMDVMGGGAGFSAYLMQFPDKRFSVICLCNGAGWTSTFEVTPKVVDLYLAGEFTEAEPGPIELSQQQLASKAGLYWSRDHDSFLRLAMREGKLQLLRATGNALLIPIGEDVFRQAGFPFPVELRFAPVQGRGLKATYTFTGDAPVHYERVAQHVPTAAKLKEYAGTYVSDEVDLVWRVVVENGRLLLKRLRFEPSPLEPTVSDVFLSSPTSTIRFTRDNNGRITGLLMSSIPPSFQRLKFIRENR